MKRVWGAMGRTVSMKMNYDCGKGSPVGIYSDCALFLVGVKSSNSQSSQSLGLLSVLKSVC